MSVDPFLIEVQKLEAAQAEYEAKHAVRVPLGEGRSFLLIDLVPFQKDVAKAVWAKMCERRDPRAREGLTRHAADLAAKVKSAEDSLVPMLEKKSQEKPTDEDVAAAIRALKKEHGPRNYDKLPREEREALQAKHIAEKKAAAIEQQRARIEELRAEHATVVAEINLPREG